MRTLLRSLDLPPPFRLVALREASDAFAHARSHAADLGAGALVFVGRYDLAEFAVVLEPEEKLATARLAFYAAMAALAEALAAAAPPEKPISIAWPDAVVVDHGLVGGGRLAWPTGCDEDAVPDWLVFAAMLLAPFLFSTVRTQVNGNLAGAISQLLDHPAPPPPPPKDLAEVLSAMEEAAIKAGADDPPDPGEDAPIRVLIDYWERQVRGGMGKRPSEKVSQRLLLARLYGPIQ